MNKNGNTVIFTISSMLIVSLVIIVLLLTQKPYDLIGRLSNCWFHISICTLICINVFIYNVSKEKDIFSPFVMTSALFFAIFFYAPLMCITTNDLYAVGNVDVYDGCIKATYIFLVSYLSFTFGYTLKRDFVFDKFINNNKYCIDSYKNNQKSFEKVKIASLMWIFCYFVTLIYDLSRGISIFYILSYGTLGQVEYASSLDSSLAILGNFSYSLIILWLYIWHYTDNKILIILIGYMTGAIYFTRGFRFIMMIMILSPIIYKYLLNDKRPKLINTVLSAYLLIVLAGMLEASRGAIRNGQGGIVSGFSATELFDRVFASDFTIFKQFYAMVIHIPKDYGYTFGQEMFLYTLIMIIPRGLWSGKPDFPYKTVLRISLNRQAVWAGQAWPIIGAFYFEFGVIGCILFMFILGYVFARIYKKLLKDNDNDIYKIGYSVFLPSIMQIICRGCIPQQTYMLLFTFLPIIIIEKLKVRVNTSK